MLAPGGGLHDLSGEVTDIGPDFFAAGGLDRVHSALSASGYARWPVLDQAERVGSCVSRPGKVVCVGLNYAAHAAETGLPAPEEPILFLKAPQTVVGPDDGVTLPQGSLKTDWEIELGVVIGRTAHYLEGPESAAEVIGGYALSHDVSERHFQLERGGQWSKGKSCETFNPLGPWLVTPDEIPDVQSLELRLSVNGQLRQSGNTSDMIFPVAHLIWYISQFMLLEPGDLINTGTPAGVGMAQHPPQYLKAGDEVRLDGVGLGTQQHVVRALEMMSAP